MGCAGADELVPVLVHLLLVLAVDKKREPLGKTEVRAAVIAHERLTTDDEFGGIDRAVFSAAGNVLDSRVRERSGVKRYCRLELVVEHQEWRHFGHRYISLFVVAAWEKE